MNFKDYLTEEERIDCWKAGMVRKMASCGVTPSQLGFEKTAQIGGVLSAAGQGLSKIPEFVGGGVQNAAALALLLGLPLGAVLHFVDRSMRRDNKEIEKLTKIRDTYQGVIESVKNRAGAHGYNYMG